MNAALNLTAQQELLIRRSLKSLAEFPDSVLLLFYDRLFDLDPAGAPVVFESPIEQQGAKA